MKQFLLCLFAFTFSAYGFGQCVPQADFTGVDFGVAPDTIQNFIGGDLTQVYTQQVDVKVPQNGGFVDPLLIFASVDSVVLAQIENLPPGLSYECATQTEVPCTFLGGSIGCLVISGIPLDEGAFELGITLLIYTSLSPTAIEYEVDGYRIIIGDLVSTSGVGSIAFGLLPNVPNPAIEKTVLKLNSPKNGEGLLTIYDLVGKKTMERKVKITAGLNNYNVSTSEMNEGLYIYRIDAFGESFSSRLIVSH